MASYDHMFLPIVVDVSAKEMWLEVHKLPKENWLNELDTIVQALKKKEEKKDEQTISDVVTFSNRSVCLEHVHTTTTTRV